LCNATDGSAGPPFIAGFGVADWQDDMTVDAPVLTN
jgi:hypothetical protein